MRQGKGQGSPGGLTDATQAAGSCLGGWFGLCCRRWPHWAPCLVPAMGTGAEAPVGTTLQPHLPGNSYGLPRVQGTKTPPPRRDLPRIMWRGRVCEEVNVVAGMWVSWECGHVRRLNPQVEFGQSFIIPLPFAAALATEQPLSWGLHKIRIQGAVVPNGGCVILCHVDKWQRGKKAALSFSLFSLPSDLLIPRVGLMSLMFRI